jgi:hypothetical protein
MGTFPPRHPKNKNDKCASVTSSIETGVFYTFISVYASVYMCRPALRLRHWEAICGFEIPAFTNCVGYIDVHYQLDPLGSLFRGNGR